VSALGDLVGEVRGSIEGASLALLLGLDGMVVACSGEAEPPSSWDLLAAHSAEVLRTVREASRETRREPPAEVVIAAPSGTMLLRALARQHALLVLLPAGAILGKARYEARRAAERLLPELD